MAWQDDYYVGSSDYPISGEDEDTWTMPEDKFLRLGLDAGGHLADDVAAVLVRRELAATLVSKDTALD